MEVARHVQNIQNRNLVIFLQYINKNCRFMFYCDAKHSDILRGSNHVWCYFFQVCNNFAIYRWKENLPHFNKFFSSSFISTSPAIGMPKSVPVWPQLDNEVSNWFPWLYRIDWGREFLLLIYHCFTKWVDFRLQNLTYLQKGKKTTSCEKWLLGFVLQKCFPKIFTKFAEKYLC